MELEYKKKHKVLQNSNVGVGEDKISDLPDELIHHILSFVPTKCALSTCILSKRWKYISNSIPTLDFRGWRPVKSTAKQKRLETQQFMDFLDTVLCLHEKPNIKKFSLSWPWDGFPDESRVNKWISIVIKRKVEELFLKASQITSFIFPLSLFTCESLTVLDLDGFKLNIPKTVSFPTLKLLRLTNMQLGNGISPDHLISNCPILEELSLHGSTYEGLLCISNPALKRLSIWYGIFKETTVKICAPNLTTISYGRHVPADFVIDNFPSLAEADIDIYYDAKAFALIKLFEKLSNIKLLKVSVTSFRVLSKADIPTDFPAFNNLIHLEVGSYFPINSSSPDYVSTVITFLRFLMLSPNLESIVFARIIHIPDEATDGRWSPDLKYSLSNLKSIKFKDFSGEPMQLNAVKLFIKYAGFLETVTIKASWRLTKDNQLLDVAKQLLMLPKPANCVINLT